MESRIYQRILTFFSSYSDIANLIRHYETDNGTDDIWWILEGQDYPRLWWELIPEN